LFDVVAYVCELIETSKDVFLFTYDNLIGLFF